MVWGMADERAAIAQVLRRTTFGPFPGQCEHLSVRGVSGAIDAVLSAAPLTPASPVFSAELDQQDDYPDGPARRWLQLMSNPGAGIHEKMVWFWHGHLTSSHDKVDSWALMWRQHLLLREHALGNFRALMHAVTVDGAMLQYLDGADSTADQPNENYGRELMELFTLGRGHYDQADVRAAATALAGWRVDDNTKVLFTREVGGSMPNILLGRNVRDAADVVDAVCDHPACAPFITSKLYRFLIGTDPAASRLNELAELFASSGLQIRPLVEAIVRDPVMFNGTQSRPRYPVEWVVAALGVFGIDDSGRARDALTTLGQTPFLPPNVAGWPPGPQWVSPGRAIAKAALTVQAPAVRTVAEATDPVAAAFERAAIYTPSATSAAAVRRFHDAVGDRTPDRTAASLLGLVVSTPEFGLA
jgi:uncharacterized protein (DUF1800 family)